MRMKTPLLVGAFCLAYATPAYACTFWFSSSFMSIPARPTFGVGVGSWLSDPAYYGISGDVAMKLGEKAVVRPAIGICSGNSQTDPFFGAGLALKVVESGSMSLNIQSGISYLSADGGSETGIPIGAAASFKGSGNVSFFAGAALQWWQVDYDTFGSESGSDPMLYGGLMANSGGMSWTLGGQVLMGDDTDFGIVAGLSLSRSASAIRHLGSVFRR